MGLRVGSSSEPAGAGTTGTTEPDVVVELDADSDVERDAVREWICGVSLWGVPM